uniref:Uncharacterized protein n=1 Tax=Brassica oleracea TaxID=3712 RepID=A0A3P6C357_BRAOL|nr:unnamed protein product [Brassica oleracea]
MYVSTTTSSLFNNLNRTETQATKSYLQHKNNNNKRATQSFKTSRNQTTSAHKDSGKLIPPYKSKINQSTTPLPNFSSIREDLTVGFTKHSRQHC